LHTFEKKLLKDLIIILTFEFWKVYFILMLPYMKIPEILDTNEDFPSVGARIHEVTK
jgi:hypothetical protein